MSHLRVPWSGGKASPQARGRHQQPDRRAVDRFYNEAKAQPMTVERVNGVLVAKAVIGVISQGNRGFRTLFR